MDSYFASIPINFSSRNHALRCGLERSRVVTARRWIPAAARRRLGMEADR